LDCTYPPNNYIASDMGKRRYCILYIQGYITLGQNSQLERLCIMIWFYSGTPGSGKSLHMAKDIYFKLLHKKQNVIANFPVDTKLISNNGKKKIGNFIYKDNSELTVKYLVEYAKENHVIGKEGQTLVCIDECQVLFNPREFDRKDRLNWITFFTQHRKFGYNFILCSQFDRLVDRQIRCLFEYEIKHRKVNNFGIGVLLPVSTFVCVTYWYGIKEKIAANYFIYRRKYADIYNSFMLFDGAVQGFI